MIPKVTNLEVTMKWKESILCVDLNESKLNVREDNEQHFEIVPKLFIEPVWDTETGHGDRNGQVGSSFIYTA